ncbi:phage tail protein [Hylemonella sp. W303a]|uniref:TipJ family phage tail tip protein n=1 Tax=Hylemonella sp. W303a TaxID=3389873 RepID=UPI00396B24EB
MDVTPQSSSLVLSTALRPFEAMRVSYAPAGQTLAELLDAEGLDLSRSHLGHWHVSVGGVNVPQTLWVRVRPKPGQIVEIAPAIKGGNARNIAMIAVAIVAIWLTSGAAAPYVGTYGAYAAVAVQYVGMALINKYLPPPIPRASDPSINPTYSLQGGRNRARPYKQVALVLGETKMVPDFANEPWTWFQGPDQYQSIMLDAGIHCGSVSDIKIGDTSIDFYQDVTVLKNGFWSGNTGQISDMTDVETVAGSLIEHANGWTTRTTSDGCTRIDVDIEATLYRQNSQGSFRNAVLHLEIEYRRVGTSTWEKFYVTEPYNVVVAGHTTRDREGNANSVPGYTYVYTPTDIELSSKSTTPLRRTFTRNVEKGQYDVRMRKVTPDVGNPSDGSNTVYWTQLKSYLPDPADYAGQARAQIMVRASGQLNGALDEVSWIARSQPLEFWDARVEGGGAWTLVSEPGAAGVSNPGAQILRLLRGIRRDNNDNTSKLLAGAGLSDHRIDMDSLKGFMTHCALNDYRCDMVVQESMGLNDLLQTIASCGMGSVGRMSNGKWGVTWFSKDQPVRGVINMASMKARSFAVSYDLRRTADELQVEYFDAQAGWAWRQVGVPMKSKDQVFEQTARRQLQGITREEHAAELARFYKGQDIYGRKSISFEMDWEYLTHQRGSLVALSHDLTQWGYGGRLVSAETDGINVTLELDNPVPSEGLDGSAARYIGLRLAGEMQYRVFEVESFEGETTRLTLKSELGTDESPVSPWPTGVALPGSGTPAWDTLWIFDFRSTPGLKARITSIEPGQDGDSARVTVVPEPDEFWTFVRTAEYSPPPSQSLVPRAPVISAVTVTEELKRQGSSFYTEVTASFDVVGPFDQAELWGTLVESGEFGGVGTSMALLTTTRTTLASWRGSLDETWLLELRPFHGSRKGPTHTFQYDVRGLRVPPAALLSYTAVPEGERLLITLSEASEPDIAGYELRSTDSDWGSSGQVYRGPGPQARVMPPLPGSTMALYAKAFDTSGNYSAGAALAVTFTSAPIPAPSSVTHVFQTTSISGSTVTLDWSDVSVQFGLGSYLVSYEVEGLPKVKMAKASSITLAADWIGTRHFQIQATDQLGNIGGEIDYYINKTAPGGVLDLDGYTIDNTVTLSWEPASASALPISHYRIYKNGTLGWRSDAHRITLAEQDAGVNTYGIAPVDTDGREGAVTTITLNVAAPPDFVRHGRYVADGSGVKSKAYLIPANGALLLPVDPSRSRADVFDARGWSSRADKMADGYARWVQPAHDGLVAYYEQMWDAGQVLPAMIIRAQYQLQFLSGSGGAATITLTTALDSDFTSGVLVGEQSTPIVADEPVEISDVRNNFRYWKIRLAVSVPNDATVLKLLDDAISVDLFVKVRTEQLTGRTVPGGAHALRSSLPTYWNVWEPAMSMPPRGWNLLGADTENAIVLDGGPSEPFGGQPEPLWACVNAGHSTGLRVDGLPAALSTTGLLYACWVKQDMAAGQFEIAGATDGSLQTLAGAPVTGALATLNLPLPDTWYLVAIYVHPAGYVGVDTGYSGVYDDQGELLDVLEEFRSDASVTHAAFSAAQAASSGTLDSTLWLCRPALMSCTAAQVPERIAYLVRCATQPGIALPLPSDLLATVSIAPGVAGNGGERLAPQVDSDPATLSHINEFVFNSAEALVEADVTAVIRRY